MDGGWQGAPAGLVRKDLSPKPIYERLLEMIKNEWWTQVNGNTDNNGNYKFTIRSRDQRYKEDF